MRRYQLSEDVATEPCAARGDDASGGFRVTTQTLEQFRVAKIGGGTVCILLIIFTLLLDFLVPVLKE
jgi:hypothetical protein